MKTKLLFVIFLSLLRVVSDAQNVFPKYSSPVDFPILLSGTFGELRSNSFHAGIDIRTGGVEGKSVYADADGYVSRIGVSPFGYGKVLYVTHPDGFTSVFAHLQGFNDTIAAYVKQKQYEKQSFALSLFPEKNQFPVKQGQVLGFSGNTGGSGGPHLHYEIRYTKTEKPVNPLYFGLKLNDTQKPIIKALALYAGDNDTQIVDYIKVKGSKGVYALDNDLIPLAGKVYFGISTFDKQNGSVGKNGVYSIELFADDELIFCTQSNSFSYPESRYINSLIDYAHWIETGDRFVRSQIDTLNELKMYQATQGCVQLHEGDTVAMKYVVKDYFDNISTLNFKLLGQKKQMSDSVAVFENMHKVNLFEETDFEMDGFEALIAPKSFYRNNEILLTHRDTTGFASRIYTFGTDLIPVHKSITIRLLPYNEWMQDTLLYVVSISRSGTTSSLGGNWNQGYFETRTKSLGDFALLRDTLTPQICSLNVTDNQTVENTNRLKWTIVDKESGIKSYKVLMNDVWVLAEYDAKNKLLFYDVDNHVFEGKNTVKVLVVDQVGNSTVWEASLNKKTL